MSKFKFLYTKGLAAIFLGIFSLLQTAALAQLPASYCDGNPADWANFQNVYPVHGYKLDPANAVNNTDDQFTQGSKDGQQTSFWHWSFGSANAKGDITNAAAALVDGCILRFAADRTSDNGDASIGFWFFRNPVTPNPDGTFNGLHSNGDLLILSDFTSGGRTPTIKIYEWLNGDLVLQNSPTGTCANVNHTTAAVPAGFSYTASNGSTTYAPNLFFEGAIDLCALNLPTCFSYFLVETRNSQSITASLQDFAANTFNATPPNAQANITHPTCTVPTGTINITAPLGAAYSYSIDGVNFQSSPTFNNVPGGTYTITVKTVEDCRSTSPVTVNAAPPTPPAPQLAVVHPTCTTPTGSITVTSPTGAGLTYSLDGTTFQSSNVFSGLAAGNYTVTVKNSAGCTANNAATVNPQPATPARPVVTIQEATVCGTTTVPTVTVSCPEPGTYILKQTGEPDQGFTYTGSNGPVVFSIKPGLGGFVITVTNAAGCVSAGTDCSNYTSNSCPQPATVARARMEPAQAPVLPSRVTAAPNPFNDRVRFVIQPEASGQGALELYNFLGQKVRTLYEGSLEKGRAMTIEYSVPRAQRSNLIYVFRIGHQRVSGKLISLQ